MAHRSGKSRRDNFTQSAIAILYKRSGGKCCRCGATTFGPVTNNLTKYRNIGQAAHIAAAAPGGPRYDPNMSAEERTSATNGLWLCSNCHDVIDRDVEEFTIQRLREIKRVGEERARKEVGVATVNVSCNTMPISTFRFLNVLLYSPSPPSRIKETYWMPASVQPPLSRSVSTRQICYSCMDRRWSWKKLKTF